MKFPSDEKAALRKIIALCDNFITHSFPAGTLNVSKRRVQNQITGIVVAFFSFFFCFSFPFSFSYVVKFTVKSS